MALLLLLLFLAFTNAENTEVTPEFLDQLFEQQRYEEVSHYMGIENSNFVRPNAEVKENPMFNPDLVEGDIMVSPKQKELQRQGVKNTRNRWPNRSIPVSISNQFSRDERRNLVRFFGNWNRRGSCIRLRWRRRERDYVNIIKGDGCWSYVGKIGGAQGLSLGNGCIDDSTFAHEVDHAVGFGHEHTRPDRDDHVEILWNNIPAEWRSQYNKDSSNDIGIYGPYDYYSVMHYGMKAPGTDKDAFRIKRNGIDPNRVGNSPHLTDIDVQKIKSLYGC